MSSFTYLYLGGARVAGRQIRYEIIARLWPTSHSKERYARNSLPLDLQDGIAKDKPGKALETGRTSHTPMMQHHLGCVLDQGLRRNKL